MSLVDSLADRIAQLSLMLSEIPPDTLEYEVVGAELADWLLVFSSWVDSGD